MNYAPSLYHQALMDRIEPAMSYKGQAFDAWQATLRVKVTELLGFDPQMDARGALNARSLWKRAHALGTIEKIVFTSEENVDVPAYVCLPANAQPPYDFFICLQGHSTGMHNSIGVEKDDESKPKEIEGDRDFGIGCMRRGIAALCIEQRSFGERVETIQPQSIDYLCHQAAANALLLGRTLLGERIFDIDRAIDYLAERGDVDMDRIGVMGNSGGGTASVYAGGLLPRIRFTMPSCCFSTFRASVQSTFHCICNYVPGILTFADMGDLAGLIAPKPLILVSGTEDGIFPIEQARSEFERIQQIYANAGAEDECHHVVCDGGHRFYADDAWSLFAARYGKRS